mgnify:CR=1
MMQKGSKHSLDSHLIELGQELPEVTLAEMNKIGSSLKQEALCESAG